MKLQRLDLAKEEPAIKELNEALENMIKGIELLKNDLNNKNTSEKSHETAFVIAKHLNNAFFFVNTQKDRLSENPNLSLCFMLG